MKAVPDTNPKSRFGTSKPGISSIPPVALLHCGRAMDDGVQKYGLTNWREHQVSASVYYDAAFRHLASWWDGEQLAADSKVHHLGHVMACCAILLDAEHTNSLNNDRPGIPGPFARTVREMTHPMESGLCEDEGCPHHGTPHECIAPEPEAGFDFGGLDPAAFAERILKCSSAEEAHSVAEHFLRAEDRTQQETPELVTMIKLKPNITDLELRAMIAEMLKRDDRGLASFNNFMTHLNNFKVESYDQEQRSRMALYIDAFFHRTGSTLAQLDQAFDAAIAVTEGKSDE